MAQKIEKQTLDNKKELKEKLLSIIAQNPYGLTKNEMLVKSGIGQDLIDFILREVLEEYTVHLKVSEDYQVAYTFDLAYKKKSGSSQLLNSLKAMGRIALFIGAIILGISWVFLTIPLAFSVLGLYLAAGFFQIFFNQGFQVGSQEYLIYWLGRKEEKDRLYEEKVILSFITQNDYCLTITELMQIMDWSYEKAEQETVWLLINYEGEALVDESGVIIFEFASLKDKNTAEENISNEYQIHQKAKKQDRDSLKTKPFDMSKLEVFSFKSWDRKAYLQAKIYLMNYFLAAVLLVGTLIMFVFHFRFTQAGGDIRGIMVNPEEYDTLTDQDVITYWWMIIIYIVGYLLNVILSLIVLIRWFFIQVPAQKKKLKSIYKGVLYEYIFQEISQKNLFQTKSLSNRISNFREYVEKDKKSIKTEDLIQEVFTDFKAEPMPQESGKVAYSFAVVEQELKVIYKRREKN